MGKKGAGWLTAVRRAFRSPNKDSQQKSSSNRRREEFEPHQEEEEKKRSEKRRWLFISSRKPWNNNNDACACAPQNHEVKKETTSTPAPVPGGPYNKNHHHDELIVPPDQRHAIAVAAATTAAAGAAVATAQAAVEIIRLSTRFSNPTSSLKQTYAATLIQTAFRGFLARRAMVALKGIVKLQALVRGQNVRKQAKMTLKCMQALLRVQARVREQQARISLSLSLPRDDGGGGGGRKSMFADTNNIWDHQSRCLRPDVRHRKSTSRDGSFINIADQDWSECPRTLEELEAALQARKETALKRDETSLAFAFAHQIGDYDDAGQYHNHGKISETEVEERTKWLDKRMATKQWDACSRANSISFHDKKESIIKTVEMDTPDPKQQYSQSARKYQCQSPQHKQATPRSAAIPSPYHPNNNSIRSYSTVTPSPSKNKPAHVRSSSPRHLMNKEEKSYSTANTPSLRSIQQRLNSANHGCRYSISANEETGGNIHAATAPNYMAATESTKARVRSQSAPKQRPSTPERSERAGGLMAKKRLSFPVPAPVEPYNYVGAGYCYASFGSQNLRSPSFKSVQAGYVGLEQQSNQSCYTESIGGEISPCSTTDLRRWFR